MADLNPNPDTAPRPPEKEKSLPPEPPAAEIFRLLLPAGLRRGNPSKAALLRRAALLWGLLAAGVIIWLNLLPRISSIPAMENYQQFAALAIILTLGLLLNYALETWRQRKAAKTANPAAPSAKPSRVKAAPPGPTPAETPAETPIPGRKPGPAAKKKDRGGRPRRRK